MDIDITQVDNTALKVPSMVVAKELIKRMNKIGRTIDFMIFAFWLISYDKADVTCHYKIFLGNDNMQKYFQGNEVIW